MILPLRVISVITDDINIERANTYIIFHADIFLLLSALIHIFPLCYTISFLHVKRIMGNNAPPRQRSKIQEPCPASLRDSNE